MGAKPIGYQCLKILLDNRQSLDLQVVGVLTNEKHQFSNNSNNNASKSIVTLCKKHQLPIYKNLKEYLHIPVVDMVVSVQYHQILRQKHIDKAQKIAVNLHMAPLPEYRGCNQFSFAIVDKKKEFGTTLHLMETAIDGGDILFERRFPIPPNCMVKELYDLTVQHSALLFAEALPTLIKGKYSRTTQQSLVAERGSSYHYRHEINDLKQIDLSWPKEKIERHFRATYFPPFEPPYAFINGQKVYLKQ